MGEKLKTGIYIHIPFCESKCFYCDFISFVKKNNHDVYIARLIKEIEMCKELSKAQVETVFIGGGTPSLLSYDLIEKILRCFDLTNTKEITIEINPESVTYEKICFYKSLGINRISIGLQAIQNNLLKSIGRIHDFKTFERIYWLMRKKFDNINIDLMFGLPRQSLNNWQETLIYIKKILPEHVSVYSLIIEPKTKFYLLNQKNKLTLPNESLERQMYHIAKEILAPDYYRYEISNFAREEKFECQHNKIYWTLGNYLGFGLAAHSFFNKIRWNNTCNIKKYLDLDQDCRENFINSTQKSLMEEFMFLGLRTTSGIDKNVFKNKFELNIQKVYGSQIKLLKQKKLLSEDKNKIYLTDLGMDLANQVMSEFILN